MTLFAVLKTYLTDVKNLAVRTLIGVVILLIAFFIPVSPAMRIAILSLVITANIVRMRFSKKRKPDRASEQEEI
jgi:hypothetical protein